MREQSDLTRHCGVRCHFCSQTLGSIQTCRSLSQKNGFDLKYEHSEKKEEIFSCLHLFVCGVGSHDRFCIFGMGDFKLQRQFEDDDRL